MALERAQNNLQAADRLIGRVRLVIWKSGHTATFECAIGEDPMDSLAGVSSKPLRLQPTE